MSIRVSIEVLYVKVNPYPRACLRSLFDKRFIGRKLKRSIVIPTVILGNGDCSNTNFGHSEQFCHYFVRANVSDFTQYWQFYVLLCEFTSAVAQSSYGDLFLVILSRSLVFLFVTFFCESSVEQYYRPCGTYSMPYCSFASHFR